MVFFIIYLLITAATPIKNRFHAVFTVGLIMFLIYPSSPFSVSVSPSTSAKPESRSAMPAGNSTAWSTASSLMARCPLTRPSAVVTTLSTPSSARLELASTCPVPCLWISSPLLSVSRSVRYTRAQPLKTVQYTMKLN